MSRRVRRPIDKRASEKATDALYKSHEGDSRPNALFDAEGNRKPLDAKQPQQSALRREWVDLYAANGGVLEASEANDRQAGSPVQKCPLTWIAFRVVDTKTGEAIDNTRLDVTWPSGKTTHHATDASGTVYMSSVEPGAYSLGSKLEDATQTSTLDPGNVLSSPDKPIPNVPKSHNTSPESTLEPVARQPSCIGKTIEHKVQTGETFAGLAKAHDMTWQRLSYFNWETTMPRKINRHLRNDVGCTKKSRDGHNYLLDSEADPGIIYIPEQWSLTGLQHNHTHTIHVEHPNFFLIILENEQALRIPEASFQAVLADSSRRKGKLGRNGVARLSNPPPGDVEVTFPDLDDVEAKSLAGCAREAFESRNFDEIIRVLEHSPEMLQLVVKAYSRYFNTYTGRGFIEDVYQEATDPDALDVIEGLLAAAGLPTKNKVHYSRWDPEAEMAEDVQLVDGWPQVQNKGIPIG